VDRDEFDTEDSESVADRMQIVVLRHEPDINVRNVKARIAEVCGVRPQTVHLWFGEKVKDPSLSLVYKFCRHYAVNMEWVSSGEQADYVPTERASGMREAGNVFWTR